MMVWMALTAVSATLIVVRYQRGKEPPDDYMSYAWVKWYNGGAHSPAAIRKVVENGRL